MEAAAAAVIKLDTFTIFEIQYITNIIKLAFIQSLPGTPDVLSRPWRTSAESCSWHIVLMSDGRGLVHPSPSAACAEARGHISPATTS
jgi:hypothetical protein